MNLSFKKSALAIALATIAAPTTSFAQDTFLEEIVVTATKRASTVQDIPIAVSVTSADTIESAQIQDIADLQSVVPTLRVSQNQSSINTSYIIRGFGNGGNNPGIEPSVGVFVDGVYRSRASSSISDFPSLERVEVLSGPQSTLFGKNASAGVISIVTSKPSGETAGKVSASYGNFNALVLKGYAESAISDNAAFSIAATSNTSDGYFRNNVTGNDLNNRDRQALRGQLLLTPSDRTEVRIISDFDQIDELCCGVTNLASGPATAAINFAGGQIVPNQPFALEGFGNVDPTNEIENKGLSVQVDQEFDAFTLTSITALRKSDSFYNIDADFSSADVIQNALTNTYETFTQEFRLTSNGGEKIDWMVGGFYFDESIEHEDDLAFGPGFRPFVNLLTAVNPLTGQLAVPVSLVNQFNGINQVESALGLPVGQTFYQAGDGFTHEGTLDNEAISLFGQLDFNITDSLTATVGLNYTKDEKEATLRQTRANSFAELEFDRIGAAGAFTQITGLSPTPQNFAAVPQAAAIATAIGNTSCDGTNQGRCNPLLGLRGAQFVPSFTQLPNSVEENTTEDDEVTYAVRLAYDVNDSVNVYGSYATGFKASSWNMSRDSRPTAAQIMAIQNSSFRAPNQTAGTRFAAPEIATLFEVGLKSKFERGALNVAIFDQSIEDFQSNVFNGTGFDLANAGESTVRGIEFDATYFPVDNLELGIAGAYLDATYGEFQNGAETADGQAIDLSGRDIPGVNDLSLSAVINYRFTLAGNDAFIRADYFYEDNTAIGIDLPENPVENIGQFFRETRNVNLAAGLTTESGLGFTLWIRNATDHETLTSAFPGVAQDLNFSGYRNAPRTYGVTVTYGF